MLVKVNPTGTHEHNGRVKIRLDLYPGPSDKTYAMHHVDQPDRPYTEKEMEDEGLRALVPTHKELNPCLCHFVAVDEGITSAELQALIRKIFDLKTLVALDNALVRDDSRHRVEQIMRGKRGGGQRSGKRPSASKLRAVNDRLVDVEVSV